MFAAHKKTITALVGAVVAFATSVVVSPRSSVSASEWLSGAIGVLTALGVYGVGNAPRA